MRLIKTFSIAAIAAIAGTMFIGAPAATATESTALCKSDEGGSLTCKEANQVKEVHAVATTPLLDTSIVDVKCTSSLAKAEVLASANPQIVHLGELTWTSCKTHGGTNCTVKSELLGLLEVSKTAANLAEATSSGTVIRVTCGESMDCSYGSKPTLHGAGASLPTHAGQLKISTTVSKDATHGGSLCPNSATLLATYEALEDVYVKS